MICVYALVSPSPATPGVTGLHGERLRRVSFPGVVAIVGVVPSAPRPTTAAIRRYDVVMRRLASRFPAILPSRFGTCVPDEDELAAIVRSRRRALVRDLRLVRHRVQMTVRIFGEGSGPAGPFRRSPDDEHRSGTAYLRARVEAMAHHDVPGLDALRAGVRRWVKAERVEKHERGRLLVSVYHLIPSGSAPAYQRAADAAALASGITTIVSGPWAPYAFAEGW